MTINILDHHNDLQAKAKNVHIPGMDWEDVYQEVALHLLTVQHKYDANKASERTFVCRVATNKIRDLVRRAKAQKRGLYQTISLDRLLDEGFEF